MIFEEIVTKSQRGLKKALQSEINRMGYKPHIQKGFLYARGAVPVLLVAHLDTVHRKTVKTLCYSSDRKIIMSPEGIGADDRAGVYMILQIIRNLLNAFYEKLSNNSELMTDGIRCHLEKFPYIWKEETISKKEMKEYLKSKKKGKYSVLL